MDLGDKLLQLFCRKRIDHDILWEAQTKPTGGKEFSEEHAQSPTRHSGPRSHCACLPHSRRPQPALCTWLSICKQWLRVNSLSFELLGPQGDTRSPTNMKRVNEPQLQSNYSPAMTERSSQKQDWAVVQLRVESISHGGANLLAGAVTRAHKAAHSEHCQPTGSRNLQKMTVWAADNDQVRVHLIPPMGTILSLQSLSSLSRPESTEAHS